MRKLFRWPVWAVLTVLAVTIIFSTTAALFRAAPFSTAHAAGSASGTTPPTLSLPDIVHPHDTVPVAGQGFGVGDTVTLILKNKSLSYNLGSMTCDSNGNCSGIVMVPGININLAQGIYPVIGTGNSGLSAQTSVALLPAIYASLPYSTGVLTAAGPGTILQLNGGAFNPKERLSIYWETVRVGASTTKRDGTFSYVPFNVPRNAAPGQHMITVIRANQTPVQVSTYFTVLAPKLVSSAGIRNSQQVHVQLSGFQANENVTISWNANGGQTMTTLAVDQTGAVDTYFAPPFAPKGAYTLTATGVSSGLKATSSMNIGPGILLAPNTANPGGEITVYGGGYTPGETVKVSFQVPGSGMDSTTVDASGSFSVLLGLPSTYKQGSHYSVYAISTSGGDAAKAPFFFAKPSVAISCSCTYGEAFTVTGQAFVAYEQVNIYRRYSGQQDAVLVGSTTTNGAGAFSLTSTLTSAPYTGTWPPNMSITARGSFSNYKVTTTLMVQANILPQPFSGFVGQKIKLTGGGFGSGETVTLSFQNHPLGTVIAGPNGGFSTTFIVPKGSIPGSYQNNLDAVGNTTGVAVDVPFGILPAMKISPATGPSGTIISVSGNGYLPSDLLDIDWYDMNARTQTQLTSLQPLNGGGFSRKITAPANLISGYSYEVVVIDTNTGTLLQALFIAQ